MTAFLQGRTAAVLARACIVAGAVVLTLGAVAGYANRVLLDGPTFADKVNAVRQTGPVSVALGRSLSDQYIARHPDVGALRPLVETVATTAVASDLLSGPTRAAAGSFQQAATTPNSQQFVLRVADAGALLAAVVPHLSQDQAPSAPSSVSLELAHIGSQTWSGRTIRAAQLLRFAAWVMPLAGLALCAFGVYLSRRRRRAMLLGGFSLLGSTAVVALLLLIADHIMAGQDTSTVHGALLRYGWVEFAHPLWWWLGALALLAVMVTAAAASLLPEYDASEIVDRAWHLVARRPESFGGDLVRALLFVVAGVATLIDPQTAAKVVAVLIGTAMLLYGMAELARATNDEEITLHPGGAASDAGDAASTRRRRRIAHPALVVTLAIAVVAAGGYAAWAAGSNRAPVGPLGAVAGKGEVCDGYSALCARRYNEVAYAATHNSMTVSGQPGWFLAEQGLSMTSQLDIGVRGLLFDVWPGQPRVSGGVATAPGSYQEALDLATKEFGPDIVAAGLRLFNAVSDPTPSGPEALFLCHGMCELGSTNFLDQMNALRGWLDTHPDETLSIVIEDHAPAGQIAADLVSSGLAAYAYQPVVGGPWPTLHDMITSGHRLVVMLEAGQGGPAYPWLVNAFADFVQDTPYTVPTVSAFTCAPNRGRPTAPLFLVNHWLSGFSSLVSDAQKVNTLNVLGGHVQKCQARRQLPNFVAVNFAEIGDVAEVVRQLNRVPATP